MDELEANNPISQELMQEVEETRLNEARLKVKQKFIFNEKEVLKNKVFVQDVLEGAFFFGILLPRYKEKILKNNTVVKTQVFSPALITSNREIVEIGEAKEKYMIKIHPIPGSLENRWSLKSIDTWLDEGKKTVNGKKLFEKIRQTYERFLFFGSKDWYNIHPLWDIGTYFFNLFSAYPILELRGLSGTAKTKIMKVSRMLTFNATQIMVNPSESSLFRETDDKRPTKYIDEAEKLYRLVQGRYETDDRVELINGSYSKGTVVKRAEKTPNGWSVANYHCYSPTMLGSIKGLMGATESRSITHITTKAPDFDKRGNIEIEDSEEETLWQELRDDLYVFALQHWKELQTIYRNMDSETITKRDFQLWKPLLSIAKLISEELYLEVKSFAEKLSKQRKEDVLGEESFDYKILKCMHTLVKKGVKDIFVKEIKETFKTEYSAEQIGSGFNKTLSSHMDAVGFKEFRRKSTHQGSYFEITKETWNLIVQPLIPELAFIIETIPQPIIVRTPEEHHVIAVEQRCTECGQNIGILNADSVCEFCLPQKYCKQCGLLSNDINAAGICDICQKAFSQTTKGEEHA